MLFLIGIRTSRLGDYPLPGVRCLHCAAPESLRVVVFSRYFHVFWLPVLPVGKRAVSVCGHCQQTLEARQWPPAYQPLGWQAQQQAKVPLTNYLGLLLLGIPLLLLLGIGLVGSVKDAIIGKSRPAATAAAAEPDTAPTLGLQRPSDKPDEATAQANAPLLAAPRPGDQYAIVNSSSRRYGIMVIERISPDTVYVRTSTWMPVSLTTLREHPDSVRQNMNTFVVPMLRSTLSAINENANLTVLRP